MAKYNCDYCGNVFERVPSKVTGENKFCGRNCKNKHLSESSSVDVECSYCGESDSIPISKFERKDNHFCDRECMSDHYRTIEGEQHPLYDKVEVSCAWCGDSFKVKKHRIDKRDNFFCDISSCYARWRSENIFGDEHPQSKEGTNNLCYGPNWGSQREKCLERDDYRCLRCGMTEDEHKEIYSKSLVVHHIVPLRTFNRDFESANDLDNLATVCVECHTVVESLSSQEQELVLFRGGVEEK